MYTGTNMRKENERANGWNFPITGDGPSVATVVTFKVELCIHAYRRMRVYGMCKVTVINVCACVQAAVAAVNLSGGAWIEYVPWKLHDVGQRLLLADKKTEEGRTGRWGKRGVRSGRGWTAKSGLLRRATSHILYVGSSAPSRCTTRDFLCAPGHDEETRVSRKNRIIGEALWDLFHVHASRNLSYDCGKQSREKFESEKSRAEFGDNTDIWK